MLRNKKYTTIPAIKTLNSVTERAGRWITIG